MTLSRPSRFMAGITLLTVPTIAYGGLTVLAVITGGAHGLPPAGTLTLTPLQQSLFRAGHAHAGALVILSLVIQVLLDSAALPSAVRWLARVTAPAAAVLLSAGFFGIAFIPQLSALLWAGALSLTVTVVLTGVGLVRTPGLATSTGRGTALAAGAALTLVASVASAGEGTGRIDVTLSGTRATKGVVTCALFSSPAGFPMEARKHALTRTPARTEGGTVRCAFDDVAPGDYAVAVLHDANGNEKTDTNLFGVPTEGWGVSNNATAALAPPSFAACKFTVAAGQTATQAVTMRY